MPQIGRSLQTVLQDGEIVKFRDTQAYFLGGQLIRSDDNNKKYNSPTAFANDVSGGSYSGWIHCKVMRDGIWKRLNELPIIAWTLTGSGEVLPPAQLKSDADKETEMPPRIRRVKTASEAPAPVPKSALPPPKSLTVSAMEAAETALPVRCIIRIPVRNCEVGSKSYWRHAAKEKLFQQLPNGGVGPYVGRLAGEKLDTTIPDSDNEA